MTVSVVTIFYAVKLAKAELPEFMDWILVAYVAFQVVVHLVLSVRHSETGINNCKNTFLLDYRMHI